ncbi:MAG: DUF2147 domain-containing protein [Ancylobacter novellus]|uniref:DUF2147 domain-containing protein n=1 Tax=Ancylobacter novellus TaxID=921 RepID=A0A2W5KSG2_ANCNO|nr:MAG: DUF2147 domain-containing protein [Ancylobacter novellus]
MIRSIALAPALCLALAAAASADPVGVWSTPKAKVRVSDCGSGLCATILSLKEPNDATGQPKVDRNNPDPSKKSRPIVGISVLSGMKPDGARWLGQIYNPEDGRSYKAYMTEGDGKLTVEGCAFGGLVCKTQIWKRSE